MTSPSTLRTVAAVALGCVALAAASARASAGVAVAGGVFSNGGSTHGGAIASLGVIDIPLAPVRAELSVAVPFANGGYATTLDARASFAGTTVGVGAGFGTLGSSGAATTGAIYDGILAHDIAPHVALEVRDYFGARRGSTLFAGVRLSI